MNPYIEYGFIRVMMY